MNEALDPLFRSGLVVVRGERAFGHILFTQSFLFALRPNDQAAASGGAIGGLLGFFIGAWVDSKRAKSAPPPHLKIPEIVSLDPKLQKKLLKTKLLCSIPLSSGLTIKREGTGLSFSATGYPTVTYKGILHRKGILAYLQKRSIPVAQ